MKWSGTHDNVSRGECCVSNVVLGQEPVGGGQHAEAHDQREEDEDEAHVRSDRGDEVDQAHDAHEQLQKSYDYRKSVSQSSTSYAGSWSNAV